MAFQAYLQKNSLSQSEIGRLTGVPQPQVNRFLSGRTRSVTDGVRKLCIYANIDIESGIDTFKDNAPLAHAVSSVWDGSDRAAEVLAELIRALGPIMRIASRQGKTRERKGK